MLKCDLGYNFNPVDIVVKSKFHVHVSSFQFPIVIFHTVDLLSISNQMIKLKVMILYLVTGSNVPSYQMIHPDRLWLHPHWRWRREPQWVWSALLQLPVCLILQLWRGPPAWVTVRRTRRRNRTKLKSRPLLWNSLLLTSITDSTSAVLQPTTNKMAALSH